MGNNARLLVKISETPEQKETRLSKPQDDSLYKPSSFEDTIDDTHTNPFLPQYKSVSLQSPDKPKPTIGSMPGTPLSPVGGASSLNALSGSDKEQTTRSSERVSASPSVNNSSSVDNIPCHVCGTATFSRCSKCKTAYCSLRCQTNDWPKHQAECKLIQSQENTDSDDEPPVEFHTPPHSTANSGLLEVESGDSFDELCTDEDIKYQKLKNEIKFHDGNVETHSTETAQYFTDNSVPNSLSVPLSSESEIFLIPAANDRYKEPEGVPLQTILPQFSLVSPLPSLPLEADNVPSDFPMIVTNYCDVTHFGVVPASVESLQALLKIKEFGSRSDLDPEYLTAFGTICGYKDNTGAFYRMRIIHPPSQTVELYDFGYRAKLPFTNFVKLPDEISSIPSLFKLCSLNNVFSNSEVAGGSKYLKELVNLNPVLMCVHNLHRNGPLTILCCYIFSLDKQTSIHEKIVTSRYIRLKQLDSKSSLKQDSFQSNATTQMTSTPSQQLSVARNGPYRPVQMASKVPFHNPPSNVTLTIVPKVILNPNLIWAQIMHTNFPTFHKMQADINAICQASIGCSYAPSVGEMCIAKFVTTQLFYRAEVLCVNHDETVDVQFVDLGHRETVSTEELLYILPQFLTLPKQALRFSLAGIGPTTAAHTWNDAPTIILKGKILNRRVQVDIVATTSETYEIEMYDVEDPSLTMNNFLVKKGLANVDVRHLTTPTAPLIALAPNISSSVSVSSLASPSLVVRSKNQLPSLAVVPEVNVELSPLITPSVTRNVPNDPHQPKSAHVSKTNSSSSSSFNSDIVKTPIKSPDRVLPPLLTKFSSSDSPRDKVQSSPVASTSRPCSVKSTSRRSGVHCVELEENTSFRVTVTHITSPHDFWVQQLSKPAVNRLLSLYDKITSTELVPLTSISAGSLCLCCFSADNQVHRARIHSLESDKVSVSYIDYGNFETVPLDRLFTMGHDLFAFDQLATSCTINKLLNPQGKSSEWSNDAIDFFKEKALDKEVEMNVVKCMGRKHVVEIFVESNQGKTKMLDLFIENNLGMVFEKKTDSVRPQKGSFPSSPQKPQSQFERKSDNRANTRQKMEPSPKKTNSSVIQRNPPSHSSEDPDVSSKHSIPTKLSIVYPKVAEMKVVELQGEINVMVTEVYSPHSIIVQPASTTNATCLDQLSTGLSTLSPPLHPDLPSVGSLCCANFSEDGLWYRAEVLKHTLSGVEVNFIDYGNTEIVPVQSITQCPKDIVDMPVCAVKCSLKGLQPLPPHVEWSAHVTTHLKTVCADKILQAKVLDSDSPIKSIQLFDTSNDKADIAGNLIKEKLAVSTNGISSKLPKISDIPQCTLPSGVFKVAVSNVDSPGEIYVQLATPENAELLEKLSAELNDRFSGSPPTPLIAPPTKGCLCAAKWYQDGAWYRAEVLTASPTNCKVKFIDYGNKDTIEINDLAVCPDEFLTAPCFAVECGLAGVESPNSDKTWPKEAIEHFTQATSDKLLKAKVASTHPASAIPLLKLKDAASESGGDLSSELIKLGYVLSSSAASRNPQTTKSSLDSGGKTCAPTYQESKPLARQSACTTKQPSVPIVSPQNSPVKNNVPTSPTNVSFSSTNESFISQASKSPSSVAKPPLPMVTELNSCHLPSGAFQAAVSEVVTPTQMYLQLATIEVATMLDELSVGLNEKLSSDSSVVPLSTRAPPTKGCLCAAKFSDGAWYRAEVLTASPTNCEVKFIDYGNKDTIEINDLAVCPDEFLTAPCFATECSLEGVVSPNGDSSHWPEESILGLKELVSDKLMKAKVVRDDTTPVIKLKQEDSVGKGDVSYQMIQHGFALDPRMVSEF